MAVEAATYITDLDDTLPARDNWLHEGDNHLRLIKEVLQATFPTANQSYDLTTLSDYLVPIGAILTFYSATPPTGWKLCDGATHARSDGAGDITTPDIRHRFILGAGTLPDYQHGDIGGDFEDNQSTSYAGSHTHSAFTNPAGEHSHSSNTGDKALSVAMLPAHNHGGGSHTHTGGVLNVGGSNTVGYGPDHGQPLAMGASGTIIDTQGSGAVHNHSIPTQGDHTHSVGMYASPSHIHEMTVETVPPFYALTYIMKI